LYTLVALRLIQDTTVIYVNSTKTAYKLMLYFEKFGMRIGVYNPQHPKASRDAVMHRFERKEFNLVIVPDSREITKGKGERARWARVSISNVVHFDFPTKSKGYLVRLQDVPVYENLAVLSFVCDDNTRTVDYVEKKLMKQGEEALSEIKLKREEMQKFEYRTENVFRGLTEKHIKLAETSSTKEAILADSKLKDYFKENPTEKEALKKGMRKHGRTTKYIRQIPNYLMPDGMSKPMPDSFFINRKNFEEKYDKRHGLQRDRDLLDSEKIEEDPRFIDADDLPPISGRKLWKIRHHKPLKKVRKQRK